MEGLDEEGDGVGDGLFFLLGVLMVVFLTDFVKFVIAGCDGVLVKPSFLGDFLGDFLGVFFLKDLTLSIIKPDSLGKLGSAWDGPGWGLR